MQSHNHVKPNFIVVKLGQVDVVVGVVTIMPAIWVCKQPDFKSTDHKRSFTKLSTSCSEPNFAWVVLWLSFANKFPVFIFLGDKPKQEACKTERLGSGVNKYEGRT